MKARRASISMEGDATRETCRGKVGLNGEFHVLLVFNPSDFGNSTKEFNGDETFLAPIKLLSSLSSLI
jgi:hypothetical protein